MMLFTLTLNSMMLTIGFYDWLTYQTKISLLQIIPFPLSQTLPDFIELCHSHYKYEQFHHYQLLNHTHNNNNN